MYRGDSMMLTFHVPPLARGQGLCDIDSLYHKLYSQEKLENSQKMGSHGTAE